MLLFYSQTTSRPPESEPADLLSVDSYKNTKNSNPKDLLKSDFFKTKTLVLEQHEKDSQGLLLLR